MTDTTQRKPWGPWSRTVAAGALGVAVALGAGSAVAESGKEWAVFGGDHANTRYSALDQINTNTVKNLKVAWMHSLGSNQSQETTPLVIDGKMYPYHIGWTGLRLRSRREDWRNALDPPT